MFHLDLPVIWTRRIFSSHRIRHSQGTSNNADVQHDVSVLIRCPRAITMAWRFVYVPKRKRSRKFRFHLRKTLRNAAGSCLFFLFANDEKEGVAVKKRPCRREMFVQNWFVSFSFDHQNDPNWRERKKMSFCVWNEKGEREREKPIAGVSIVTYC